MKWEVGYKTFKKKKKIKLACRIFILQSNNFDTKKGDGYVEFLLIFLDENEVKQNFYMISLISNLVVGWVDCMFVTVY